MKYKAKNITFKTPMEVAGTIIEKTAVGDLFVLEGLNFVIGKSVSYPTNYEVSHFETGFSCGHELREVKESSVLNKFKEKFIRLGKIKFEEAISKRKVINSLENWMTDYKIRPYHLGVLVNKNGDVSALCFKKPRNINLTKEWLTTIENGVNCKKCLAIMKQKQEAASK